jgi:cytochrome c oxidase subunit III
MVQEHLKNLNLADEPEETLSVNPSKFMLWLSIVSFLMMWAGWTSGYLVRKAEGNWHEFPLPSIFWWSTGVLLISSISMHWALISAKKDNFSTLKTAISITFVFGIAFLVMQVFGFSELIKKDIYFVGNDNAAQWLYVMVFFHGVHIISGLIVLIVSLVSAFKMNVHATKLTRIELCATYWHFLDLLWLYLFIFLLYNR